MHFSLATQIVLTRLSVLPDNIKSTDGDPTTCHPPSLMAQDSEPDLAELLAKLSETSADAAEAVAR